MRYSPAHKEAARQRLLSRGMAFAKRHGLAGSGVDQLAAAAGVTTGSFYKHFGSKSEMFSALVADAIAGSVRRFDGFQARGAGARQRAAETLASYLGLEHVRDTAEGCVMPALAADIARADADTRRVFEQGLLSIQQQIAGFTGDGELAWSAISQCVGAVLLARAMASPEAQQALLDAVRNTLGRAIEAVDQARPMNARPAGAAGDGSGEGPG